jgi:hypothetical protein
VSWDRNGKFFGGIFYLCLSVRLRTGKDRNESGGGHLSNPFCAPYDSWLYYSILIFFFFSLFRSAFFLPGVDLGGILIKI